MLAQGQKVVGALAATASLEGEGAPSGEVQDAAVRSLAGSYDHERGGFGTAPKFPPSMALEFLLRHAARGGDGLAMAEGTLEAMARGGMYDQLGGGFARYSVDAGWVVPHFEKMLYDNALLARVYAHWWRLTGAETARRVALETCEWMLRDLRTAQDGFASALDADSETPGGAHEEGAYYVWTPGELTEVLGADDGAWAAELFEVTGTFEHGTSVLQLLRSPDDEQRYERVRAALLEARTRRVPPGRDDKVVAAWNGLAIAALAECGAYFDRPDLVAAATGTARLLREVHWRDGRLLRTSREGTAGGNAGVLEDYADLAEGLIALYAVTGEPGHVEFAAELLDVVLDRFADGRGGFFDTADDAERLWKRPQDPTDNATPSGQFAAAGRLAVLRRPDRLVPAPRGGRRRAGPGRAPRRAVRAVRRVGPRGGGGAPRRAAGGRRRGPGRRPAHPGAAPYGAAESDPRRRRDRWRSRAPGGPHAGRRPPRGVRLPGVHLPDARHRDRGAQGRAGQVAHRSALRGHYGRFHIHRQVEPEMPLIRTSVNIGTGRP